MEHEKFPVEGFEFMDKPATLQQKEIIVNLADDLGTPIDMDGVWPEPFSKWDAYHMIKGMKRQKEKLRKEKL